MSIIGYSDLLLQDPDSLNDRETTLDYLKTMNTAGRDAAQVVSRLRDFYRERKIEDVFAAVDLNEVIEESVSLTQPKWKTQALESGRKISVEFDLEKLPAVSGNSSELREAITNLIFNAVDAMPNGGTLTLRSRRDGDNALLEIADTGTGMSEEVRARCLEPFFSTKAIKGLALGYRWCSALSNGTTALWTSRVRRGRARRFGFVYLRKRRSWTKQPTTPKSWSARFVCLSWMMSPSHAR
jgi:signal transduction histidine kinase